MSSRTRTGSLCANNSEYSVWRDKGWFRGPRTADCRWVFGCRASENVSGSWQAGIRELCSGQGKFVSLRPDVQFIPDAAWKSNRFELDRMSQRDPVQAFDASGSSDFDKPSAASSDSGGKDVSSGSSIPSNCSPNPARISWSNSTSRFR